MSTNKIYLGDGVYCEFSGHDFMLTTENGIEVTNTIYLEAEAITMLVEFAKSKGLLG